ncbi:MAG: mechanosensitive ion channel [Acidobacteria bacterium]|nr:mechanosensitive ion channel [Acidobacteriota bacterium]
MHAIHSRFFLAVQLPELSFSDRITPAKLTEIALLILIAWIAIQWLSKLLNLLGNKIPRSRFLMKLLEPASRIGIWFVVMFAIIHILAPEHEAFWASLASLGLAIGLGAQDLIKNVIGGIIVLIDRPYQLGDRVRIGDAYGEIDHIGLRSTKLTTPEDTRVTIPNLDILNRQVFNANSGVPDCQVVTDLYLPPDASPDSAVEIGYEAAACSPYLLAQKPIVVLVAHGFDRRPYVRLRIKAYVFDHRHEPKMMSDITSRATREFIRLGFLKGWESEGIRPATQ